jgi:hypothetical protein
MAVWALPSPPVCPSLKRLIAVSNVHFDQELIFSQRKTSFSFYVSTGDPTKRVVAFSVVGIFT